MDNIKKLISKSETDKELIEELKRDNFILKSKVESIRQHIDDVTPSFANIQFIYNVVKL